MSERPRQKIFNGWTLLPDLRPGATVGWRDGRLVWRSLDKAKTGTGLDRPPVARAIDRAQANFRRKIAGVNSRIKQAIEDLPKQRIKAVKARKEIGEPLRAQILELAKLFPPDKHLVTAILKHQQTDLRLMQCSERTVRHIIKK